MYDNISKQRNLHRNRRNIIRRIVFLLFILVSIFFIKVSYDLPNANNLRIEIVNDKNVNLSHLYELIAKKISDENFFLLSPKTISRYLSEINPLFSNVIVRKYLLPEPKILLVLKEKKIWAKLISTNNISYLTESGDVLSVDKLNMDILGDDLVKILVKDKASLSKDLFKSLISFINKLKITKLKIDNLNINNDNELEIFTADGYQINAGMIDDGLNELIPKFKLVFSEISQRNLEIKYIDFRLETSAILKVSPLKDKKKEKEGFFRR